MFKYEPMGTVLIQTTTLLKLFWFMVLITTTEVKLVQKLVICLWGIVLIDLTWCFRATFCEEPTTLILSTQRLICDCGSSESRNAKSDVDD